MGWDYAELSKAAKDAGGPEKLLDIISEAAKQDGKREMTPFIGIAFALGGFIVAGGAALMGYLKKKQKRFSKQVDITRAELIQKIKDYDEEHERPNTAEGKTSHDGFEGVIPLDPNNKEEMQDDILPN